MTTRPMNLLLGLLSVVLLSSPGIGLADPGGVEVAIRDSATAEGNIGTRPLVFQVNLSQTISSPVSLRYETADGTATVADGDYLAASGTLTINPAPPMFISKWGREGSGDGESRYPFGMAADPDGNLYMADRDNHRIEKFSSGGTYLGQWGTYGSAAGQFSYPQSVAAGGSGNVYVVDSGNSRIQKFTAGGAYLGQWGTRGSGNGAFKYPYGVSADGDENVYVADTYNHRIQRFTSDGAYLGQWGSYGTGDGQFKYPNGVAVDGSGDVCVADTYNSRIQKFRRSMPSATVAVQVRGDSRNEPDETLTITLFDTAGVVITRGRAVGTIVNDEPGGLVAMAIDSDSLVEGSDGTTTVVLGVSLSRAIDAPLSVRYEATDGTATIADSDFVATSGTLTIQPVPPAFAWTWGRYGPGAGQFSVPGSLAVDGSGTVYVADTYNHRIEKFSSDGTYLGQWGAFGSNGGEFKYPQGVTLGGSGNVYVADTQNHRIQRFTSGGTFLGQWGSYGLGPGQLAIPFGIAADGSGDIYVADTGNHRIQRFASGGAYLGQWGAPGSGPGQFLYPQGVALDASGTVYVVDTGNQRVQAFTSAGAYLGQWGTSGSGNGQFSGPRGVGVGQSGNVYVADTNNNRVQEFLGDGTYVRQWGTYGTAGGQFSSPWAVAEDGSRNVFVVDAFNYRVEKFQPVEQGATIAVEVKGDSRWEPDERFTVTLSDPVGAVLTGSAGTVTILNDDIWTAVDGEFPRELSFTLDGPNPVVNAVRFRFGLPARARIELSIYDIAGRRVATLVDHEFEAGYHAASWRSCAGAADCRAGIYFARLAAGGQMLTRRVVVLE